MIRSEVHIYITVTTKSTRRLEYLQKYIYFSSLALRFIVHTTGSQKWESPNRLVIKTEPSKCNRINWKCPYIVFTLQIQLWECIFETVASVTDEIGLHTTVSRILSFS